MKEKAELMKRQDSTAVDVRDVAVAVGVRSIHARI